jgi:tetratricopeptide (TPR) repeat protein
LYLKGRYCWQFLSGNRMLQALSYFNRALVKDPGCALAWSGLAETFNLLASYGVLPPTEACRKGLIAANRALELDGTLAEAHAALGILRATYLWDYNIGRRSLLRALELKPRSPITRAWYGVMLISSLGEMEAGLAEIRRAIQLDPVSIVNRAMLALCLSIARRCDEAIDELNQAIELDAGRHIPQLILGRVYWQKGMFAQAVESFELAAALSNGDIAVQTELIAARAMAGDRKEAPSLLNELQAASSGKYVNPFFLAYVFIALGDEEKTLALLEEAYRERATQLPWLNVEPRFDRLRSHPQFRDILRRVGY